MLDFMKISTRSTNRGIIEIYPNFIIKKSINYSRFSTVFPIWTNKIVIFGQIYQRILAIFPQNYEQNVNILVFVVFWTEF